MKKIILTLCLISGFSAVKAQELDMIDTMSRNDIKRLTSSLVKDIFILKEQIKSIDSCHYNHEKYIFSEAINNDNIAELNSPWDFMDFNLLSAEGNRNRQTVMVTLLLTNTSLNQKLYLDSYGSEAVDVLGNSCVIENTQVGSNRNNGTAYTNVPIQIKMTFKGVMPGTEKFNIIAFKLSSTGPNATFNTQTKLVEIRNVKIEW